MSKLSVSHLLAVSAFVILYQCSDFAIFNNAKDLVSKLFLFAGILSMFCVQAGAKKGILLSVLQFMQCLSICPGIGSGTDMRVWVRQHYSC